MQTVDWLFANAGRDDIILAGLTVFATICALIYLVRAMMS